MPKRRKRGMSVIVFILLSLIVLVGSALFTAYSYLKEKYAGSAVAYSREAIRNLEPGSFEEKVAKSFYTEEEWNDILSNSIKIDPTIDNPAIDEDGIEIQHISGPTYEGYMMLVHNPEDVYVAVNPNMDNGQQAPSLEDYVRMNNAIGGINAGGFQDAGGHGNGGLAWGIVIHEGQLISGRMNEYLPVIGIDSENKLICTDMTAQQALEWGIKEAVTFGPTLISDYQVKFKDGDGDYPMLNPRTGIGQRGDGTFLLLAIDGRGPSSYGALYQDMVKIFQQYDAYMAANLDGGNSTAMIYKGDYVNTTVSMYGSRHLPTVFLVRGN
ncbi:MAG: phosphodiester glycosidase family protein [Solobacterium sp.]|nr:phosphodiester glycosidase family protein [Solobacterium sp.]